IYRSFPKWQTDLHLSDLSATRQGVITAFPATPGTMSFHRTNIPAIQMLQAWDRSFSIWRVHSLDCHNTYICLSGWAGDRRSAVRVPMEDFWEKSLTR